MDIENILELVGADKLAPEIKGQITELLELLIADPKYTPALERLLTLISADRLDAPTQQTIKENLMAVIDIAAKKLLESIGSVKAAVLKQVRRNEFEKQVITQMFCSFDKKREPLVDKSDPDIEKLAKQNLKVSKISKSNFQWDRGLMSDPMKETTAKILAKDYKWASDGLWPLSGKAYRTNTKGGR